MKTKLLVVLFAVVFLGCEKEYSVQSKPAKEIGLEARTNPFPTVINLGPDLTVSRTDTLTITNVYAYLSTCGLSPEYEAPLLGSQVYQLAGPNQSVVNWTGSRLSLGNLIPGNYKYVGHAYMIGFRLCDSTYVNDNAYDTLSVTILKSRRKIR